MPRRPLVCRWGKVIEEAARIGYTSSNLFMAAYVLPDCPLHVSFSVALTFDALVSVARCSYDWRIPPQLLEQRDHYFSSLKRDIERLFECGTEQWRSHTVLVADSLFALRALTGSTASACR